MYGFNPLILIEFLINGHNDIYLLFFVLMAIYFLKNKKNIWFCLLMLAISVGIKYLTIVLAPIFVLYYLQDKKTLKKLEWIFIYFIFFVFLIYIMYLPFINNVLDIFDIITNQQSKMKDSIYLLLAVMTNKNMMVVSIVYSIMVFVVGYYYIIFCLKLLTRKNSFSMMMKNINLMLVLIIFGILTNLTSWYLSWLFISIYWIKGKDIKNILWIQFLYELTYAYLYIWHSDAYIYSVVVIPVIVTGIGLKFVFEKIVYKKRLKG